MRLDRALLCLAVLGSWFGSLAHADTGLVVVTGNAADRERRTVTAGVDAAVREAGWTIPAAPPAPPEHAAILRCTDGAAPWPCLTAANVFIVTIESTQSEAGAPIVAVTAKVLAREQQATVVRQRFCEQCADDKLTAAGHDVAVEALRALAARSGSTVVQVSSVPPGASIMLDGTRVGVTDAAFATFPGEHTVVIDKPGFAPETRTIAITPGTTATVAVTLRERATPPPGTAPSRVVPVLLLSAGAAAVLAGGVLFALDEDESRSGPQDASYNNTAPYAVAYLAGGLVAGGIGAYLWHRASRSRTAPTVALTPGGAALGWTGSF